MPVCLSSSTFLSICDDDLMDRFLSRTYVLLDKVLIVSLLFSDSDVLPPSPTGDLLRFGYVGVLVLVQFLLVDL